MNKYTITPENLSEMFCHACAAVVILEPLIEHKEKSSKAWKKVSNKYYRKHWYNLAWDCDDEWRVHSSEASNLKTILATCEQLMQSMNYIPEGNIEIPLDHAIEIVYYSKQYEYMRNLYNVVACNRNGKKS